VRQHKGLWKGLRRESIGVGNGVSKAKAKRECVLHNGAYSGATAILQGSDDFLRSRYIYLCMLAEQRARYIAYGASQFAALQQND
jgi:hypothetical protein